ncbi:flocculation protein FLO11-like [Cucurbita moschata]|uniref:Flocculation protein FLO11-like n=1 Tax=Cucurbita moschata TaxID=3662 RepID=A0A6J1FLB1_CUCMO|nr:flocculation protein FLO11-like [Cucurbita moschata]
MGVILGDENVNELRGLFVFGFEVLSVLQLVIFEIFGQRSLGDFKMNRSFRALESQMQAPVKQRQQQVGGLRASVRKDKEEELALFLEMRKREKERNDLLSNHAEEFDAPLGTKPGTSPIFNIASATPAPTRKTGADDFLNSDNDKNDYDWLITPPGTPLFPSLETESERVLMSHATPMGRPNVLKSRLANLQQEPATRSNLVSKQPASSPGLNSSSVGIRRPSSSGGPGSRPATPTGRPTLTTTARTSRSSTPTSRAILPSNKPVVSSTKIAAASNKLPAASAKPVTKTKPTVSSAKSVPARSSTPTRTTARSSTPTPSSRATIPPPKPTSRASTPTRRPSTPSSASSAPVSLVRSSSSISKPSPTPSRNQVPSRGTSPTVKSRPWNPSEMPGFSLDAPPNLRTSLPERPLSATRGRPGAPSARSSSVEPLPNSRPRRQSCSPSRGRAPNGNIHFSGGSVPAINRMHAKANDNISPVLVGTKMVERVISMRKLAPPKQDDRHSPRGNLSGKSSSPDSLGFGRTLSKKSLDMAIRHMDIRRSIPGNLRPLMTNIPASSMYSVRSGPSRSRTVSVSDSPLATSSNASSERSVNNNGLCLDAHEIDDEIGSERGGRSPRTMYPR